MKRDVGACFHVLGVLYLVRFIHLRLQQQAIHRLLRRAPPLKNGPVGGGLKSQKIQVPNL